MAEKKEREISRNSGERLLSLQGVASPSLLNYGGARLDPIGGHAGAPTRPHESGVHDGGGACGLSCT
jgi:hypothetical protein